jgi:hypothetical protein
MPPSSTPARRVHLAPRPLEDDDTQPVLRFRITARPPVRAEQAPVPV